MEAEKPAVTKSPVRDNPFLTAALRYAQIGWAVLPCQPRGKRPLTKNGVKDAITDPEVIRRWWRRWPSANVGIATGASGLVVIDLDGDEGLRSWQTLRAELGLPADIPQVATAKGCHLYFGTNGTPIRPRVRNLPGVDVRAGDSYVIAPPSVHPSGRRYEWADFLSPWDVPLPPLPHSLAERLNGKPGGNGKAEPLPERIREGQRNATLTSLAGSLRRRGASYEAILAALQEENRLRCDPPLPDDEVMRIAKSVARYEPAEASTAPEYPYTDGGSAEHYAAVNAGRVCYRHDQRRWYVWRHPIWKPDDDGEAERLALKAVRERQAKALAISDADQRKKALTFLLGSESGYRLRSMMEIAKNLKPLAKAGQEFDRSPTLLAVQNGVLDLTTGEFRKGRPDDYITQCAGTHYDPNAKAPRWEKFLREVFQGDEDLIAFVQRAVGYCLTGWTHEQIFFFCYGTGRNGKSKFLSTLRALLGNYAQHTAFSTFTKERGRGGHEDDLMALEGARLVTAIETKAVGTLAEDTLKAIVGEDPVTGSRKFERTRTFQPTFKLWLAANSLPKVNDVSDGLWRKIALVPFNAKFEGERDDKRIGEKLRAELPGILVWALQGCLEYQRVGLNPPQRCIDAVLAWRMDNDPLADFLAACRTGQGLETKASELYQAYTQHCAQTGLKPVSMHVFSPLVQAHGYRKERRRDGVFFVGVAPCEGV